MKNVNFHHWRARFLLQLCCCCLLATATEDAAAAAISYHNHFAVHIPGGSDNPALAEAVATRNGFHNLGQIGSLDDHFLFEHRRLHKRSTTPSHEHSAALETDPDVRWLQQQTELKRTKRDLSDNSKSQQLVMPDPLFHKQWYLNRGAVDGSDMNVQAAWRAGLTGRGVVVTILDDGIQGNHPDLVRNYDPMASTDINGKDDDPTPQDNGDNKHGTRCAGEVAAEAFNDVCGVGVAYNASIGGVRMLDGMVNDAVEAAALSLNPQHIDIYSASWGPEDDGKTVDGPGPLAKKAFINGVKFGRQNKGSIFVWASGNGGRKTDNCNCDGYTNSIFTLSISSATQGGRKPWYLEECSSTLSTTYSSGSPSHDASITTVDQDARLRRDKICTSSHTGTSASAPIAAGICALALEANPQLTWRDMQHIVVLTSNPTPLLHESGWRTNGVGRKYSHKFGYGLMDAFAMAKVAAAWPGVGRQVICETPTQTPNAEIPPRSDDLARVTITTSACAGQEKEINFLEHVQCKVSLHYSPRGALHIVLTSPAGTKSSLLLPRPRDKTNSGFEDWPFLSVHFWGERANGTWTLEVNHSPSGPKAPQSRGILKKWKLFFYGTRDDPLQKISPDSDAKMDAGSRQSASDYYEAADDEYYYNGQVHRAYHHQVQTSLVNRTIMEQSSKIGADGCSVECFGGCTGPGPHQCSKGCKNLKFDSVCVGQCLQQSYETVDRFCHLCHRPCATCFGPEANQCLTCGEGFLLTVDTSKCVTKCPQRYRMDKERGHCLPCPQNCLSCQALLDGGDNNAEEVAEEEEEAICLKCEAGLLLIPDLGTCVASCPPGYYKSEDDTCGACDDACHTCIGPLATQCSLCRQGTFYHERKCVQQCPPGFRPPSDDNNNNNNESPYSHRECLPCPHGCSSCNSDDTCQECSAEWSFSVSSGKCLPMGHSDCPTGSFSDQNSVCRDCHSSCETCKGSSAESCLTCHSNEHPLLHINSCVDVCPASTFRSDSGRCEHCPHACRECTSAEKCTSCHSGYLLVDGRCAANCDESEYMSDGSCYSCHPTCATCRGPDAAHCLSCPLGLNLAGNQCLERCPAGFTLDTSLKSCQKCHSSCLDCFGAGPEKCKSCHPGSKLVHDSCLGCSPKHYYDLSTGDCRPCHDSCASCSGPKHTDCTHCGAPLAFDPWNRTCVACCSAKDGENREQRCCQCGSGRERSVCVQPTRTVSNRKRSDGSSFTPMLSSPDRDVASFAGSRRFVLLVLMTTLALTAMVLLHAVTRRNRLRRTLTSAVSGGGRTKRRWRRPSNRRADGGGAYVQLSTRQNTFYNHDEREDDDAYQDSDERRLMGSSEA